MAYNSTIKQKAGTCKVCNNGKSVPLIKGLCSSHYWLGVRMKSVSKQNEKDSSKVIEEDDLSSLIEDLDTLVSRYVRMSAADQYGIAKCYTCDDAQRWQDLDAGHFIKRGNLFLRWDVNRNLRPQCQTCNRRKDGNIIEYAARLEKELPGVVEILMEEMRVVYKPTRTELRELISEYSIKTKKWNK